VINITTIKEVKERITTLIDSNQKEMAIDKGLNFSGYRLGYHEGLKHALNYLNLLDGE